jgi:hypothetical protein
LIVVRKNPAGAKNASTGLSMNGKCSFVSSSAPFALRFSKGERSFFQQ